uniref:Uncharacterized protein n=1 Tax=Pyxicephalus adspersus TaxID=30357 RepID=A0AAV2ZY14_PYXAD|nr:TPA: hypothetical protein GDO54_015427 [Pyxicephalus adspersus]
MAAHCSRMLVSGRVWSSWGFLRGAGGRATTTLIPSRAPNAKPLHTRSPLRAKAEEEESTYRGSFFVGGARAQNPMKKVGYAWAIGFPSGIILFLYAKNKVEQRRVQQMKARQRMRDANRGQYESERYKSTS